MPDKSLTELVIILDSSSSMGGMWREAVDGIAQLVEKQRALPGRQHLTLVKFASQVEPPCFENVPLDHITPDQLRDRLGSPQGMTALHDGMGSTIDLVGRRLARTAEQARPGAVLVCTVTDGQENSSREYTGARVKQMVQHQRDRYGWQFIYLGAGQDAISQAQDVGIGAGQFLNWQGTKGGVVRAFASASSYAASYHSSTVGGDEVGASSLSFTDQDRKDNGQT